MQVPCGVELGGEHTIEALSVERRDHSVVKNPGGMNHSAQGVVFGDLVEQG